MCFGAFDGLHPGHLNFFKQAKELGDRLIVSVGTDKNVIKYKGKKALFNQSERFEMIKNCRLVDKAVLGPENDYYKDIKKYAPSVICLGYDQWANEKDVLRQLSEVGLTNTIVVRLRSYEPNRAKSSITKQESVDF